MQSNNLRNFADFWLIHSTKRTVIHCPVILELKKNATVIVSFDLFLQRLSSAYNFIFQKNAFINVNVLRDAFNQE